MAVHPCLRCGACCAHFRVAFHWSEAEPTRAGGVPQELVLPMRRHELAMRSAESAPARCIALQGEVGRDGRCGIYQRRPSPCRDLAPAWEHGEPSPQCDRARIAHSLPVLTPADWPA